MATIFALYSLTKLEHKFVTPILYKSFVKTAFSHHQGNFSSSCAVIRFLRKSWNSFYVANNDY